MIVSRSSSSGRWNTSSLSASKTIARAAAETPPTTWGGVGCSRTAGVDTRVPGPTRNGGAVPCSTTDMSGSEPPVRRSSADRWMVPGPIPIGMSENSTSLLGWPLNTSVVVPIRIRSPGRSPVG